MAWRIVLFKSDDAESVLTEVKADDEAQLQSLLKEPPENLPVEEFGLEGPMMVVGEETNSTIWKIGPCRLHQQTPLIIDSRDVVEDTLSTIGG